MSWGAPFRSAWDTATEAARSAATEAIKDASGAYDRAKDAAGQAYRKSKEVIAQGYEFAEAKVVEAYGFAKESAVAGYEAGKNLAGKVASGIEHAAGMAIDDGRFLSRKAKAAFDKVLNKFGVKTAGSPVQDCPHTVGAPGFSDLDRDGWIMVPQGENRPCIAVPPGKDSSGTNQALEAAKAKAVMAASECCSKKRPAGTPPRDIVFVNGIQNNSNDHCQTLNAIAKQTCGRVVGVYNATAGKGLIGLAADVGQTRRDRILVDKAAAGKPVPAQDGRNPAVDTLSRLITKQVQNGNPPEIWLHSQGGAVGSLALAEAKNALHPVLADKALAGVKVKSFGSAAPSWTSGPDEMQHFVHVNDPVPTMLGVGADPVAAGAVGGAGSETIHFSGNPLSDEPYETASPERKFLPSLSNHGMQESYLKMEKQRNGGCD